MSPPEKPVNVLIECRLNLILWPICLLIVSTYLAPKALLCFLHIEKNKCFSIAETNKYGVKRVLAPDRWMDHWAEEM